MNKTPNQKIIQNDILRYKTNKLAASLALLSIVFNCLYFCLLYGFRGAYFGNWRLGISVILTLFSLLAAFLASEGIKNYKKKFSIVLIVLAVVQIIRIFGLPFEALQNDLSGEAIALETRYFGVDLSPEVCFTILTIWLCASAACLIASAVIGYINCVKLENFRKQLESGEISIEKALAELDVEEANAKAVRTEQPVETTGEVE